MLVLTKVIHTTDDSYAGLKDGILRNHMNEFWYFYIALDYLEKLYLITQ